MPSDSQSTRWARKAATEHRTAIAVSATSTRLGRSHSHLVAAIPRAKSQVAWKIGIAPSGAPEPEGSRPLAARAEVGPAASVTPDC